MSTPSHPPLRRAHGTLGEVFVVETAPGHGDVRETAVLVLPPLGYEETCSYRGLRVLADQLAADGHVVQRLDWPGLGDSAGEAADPDLVPRQLEAVRQLAAALRARGFRRVAAVAVRAGGLLGLAAACLDAVVLWGAPASGKRFLREQKAFHRMAAKMFAEPPPGAQGPPAGGQEAGGFWYAPQTVAALQALDLEAALADHTPVGALLIPQDGMEPPAPLRAALDAAGVAVEVCTEPGLGLLLDDPYRAAAAPAVGRAIRAWLGVWPGRVPATPPDLAPRLRLPGGVVERPWSADGGAGQLVGVICEPAGGAAPGADWTLFFNAGGVRRSGPNRLWTRAARALAAQGRPSLRIDVRDVGDADGVTEPHDDLEAMYAQDSVSDGLLAYDAVAAMGAGTIDTVGLCSGAFMGAQVAAARDVRRAVLFNGLAFVWDDEARASGFTAHIASSLLDGRRWRRLLTGKIDAVGLARAIVKKGGMKARDGVHRLRGRPPASPVARLLRGVMDRGTDLLLVSSAGDPSIAYLRKHTSDGGPVPPLLVMPGVDHTMRPVWSHADVVRIILGDDLPLYPSP